MATNILKLPKVSVPCQIESNEDWRDALAFVDADNNPIALDGIAFKLTVKDAGATGQATASAWVIFKASSADYLFALPAGGTIAVQATGTTYAIGDTITLTGGLVLTVAQIGANGAVAAVSIKTPGSFDAMPTNPLQQLSTSGSGNGAAFTIAFVNNALAILVPASVLSTALLDGSYVFEITAAADGYTVDVAEGPLTVGQGSTS